MNRLRSIRSLAIAALAATVGLGAGAASAYTSPYATPEGITLVDVVKLMDEAVPQFLWRRLGDANGKPLYTFDSDNAGKAGCLGECAKEFPPLVAEKGASAFGDWTIVTGDGKVKQWAYQGKPLYRYSGKDPVGEPVGARFEIAENPAWHDPSSNIYAPKPGWSRAAYTPEKSMPMPPSVELEGLAIANGFGFVDAATHMTIYAAPVSDKLSSDWQPVHASALALPVGDFSIVKRKDDGTRQWAYKREALYTYTGDYAPGEVQGIFAGNKSIQAAIAYRNFIPPGIDINQYPGRGPVMTTGNGMPVYTVARYKVQYGGRETRTGYAVSYNDAKSQGTDGCQGECTTTWKPVLAAANARAWGFWEVVARSDGSAQWAFKGSPLYTYVGDKAPGDIAGNNRHVIVYGGPKGEIIYADAGGDPRDVQPQLGKVSLLVAVGPKGEASNVGPVDGTAADGPLAAGAAHAARADGDAPAGRGGAGGAGRGGGDDDMPQFRGGDRRDGAGFYWHIAGLFY